MAEKNWPFDWGMYGTLIRKFRCDLGYKNVEAFTKTIYRRARIQIGRDTYYKIEQGRQVPDAQLFMAVNLVLFGDPLPVSLFKMCCSPDWSKMFEAYRPWRLSGNSFPPNYDVDFYGPSPTHPFVPEDWAAENFLRFKQSMEEMNLSVSPPEIEAAFEGEPQEVFCGQGENEALPF